MHRIARISSSDRPIEAEKIRLSSASRRLREGEISCEEGKKVTAGTVLARTPRESSGITDITGGLPRVTEIFEARKRKDPAVIAEVDGTVEILGEKRRGKRTIIVKSESGIEREHLVPHGKRFLVHSGDKVKAGQALVDGPLVGAVAAWRSPWRSRAQW